MRFAPARQMAAFTLLEVMIAMAIFFMAIFSILGVVAQSLHAARNLQPVQVDPSSVLAEVGLTNRLEEGSIEPEILDHFSKLFPGYRAAGEITEIRTNGLFQVEVTVAGGLHKMSPVTMPILLYR